MEDRPSRPHGSNAQGNEIVKPTNAVCENQAMERSERRTDAIQNAPEIDRISPGRFSSQASEI